MPLAAGEETEEESSGAASSANPYGKLVREEIAPGLDALQDEHGAWSPLSGVGSCRGVVRGMWCRI